MTGNDEIYCPTQILNCPSNCRCNPKYSWTCKGHLKSNLFSNMSFSVMNNIKSLEIINSIYSVESLISRQLVRLNIINSELKKWPSSNNLPNLLYLNLSQNMLRNVKSLTSKRFKILQYLDLSKNDLNEFSMINSLSELLYLDISDSKIREISEKEFGNLIKLKVLKMMNCYIKNLNENLWKNSILLKEIHLNKTTLPSGKENFLIRNQEKIEILFSQYFSMCCYINKISYQIKQCYPLKTVFSSCSDLLANDYVRAAFWILGLLGIFGNLSSIYLRSKAISRPSHIFYLSLTLSDLMTAIYLIVVAFADRMYKGSFYKTMTIWTRSNICKFCGSSMNFSILFSMVNLFFISSDRYLVITRRPMFKFTKRQVLVLTILSLILCALVGIFPVYYFEVIEEILK